MASSCSPLHAASHPVTTSDVVGAVSDVLRRLVGSGHLRPLVTALIDGVGDDFGSRGTGLVLAALLESRGSEDSLKSHTGNVSSIWITKLGCVLSLVRVIQVGLSLSGSLSYVV